jgi:hypothetical protein
MNSAAIPEGGDCWSCTVIDDDCRIASRLLSSDNHRMVSDALISARVTAETKERLAAIARRRGVSQSALLKRLVEVALITAATEDPPLDEEPKPLPASGRISVRLRPDDLLLLRERAKARSMASSTYVTFLLREHLRSLTPLPTVEFAALRKALMEVAAIGRNFNQMARALNAGKRSTGPDTTDLKKLIQVLTALWGRIRGLLDANSRS